MIILGINAYHADSSACLIKDGEIIAAVEEERFTRDKHWAGFPTKSILFCLNQSNLTIYDIDFITTAKDPRANFLNKIKYSIANVLSFKFIYNRIVNLSRFSSLRKDFIKNLKLEDELFKTRIINVEHHNSHLASSFFASNFEKSALLSIDGFGDFTSTALGFGINNKISIDKRILYPNSIGIFYTASTQFLGFNNYGDEYKIMGLAAYGKPNYKSKLLEIIDYNSSKINLKKEYFNHFSSGSVSTDWNNGTPKILKLWTEKWISLFGKSRLNNEKINQFHFDFAASVQSVTEDIIINLANYLYEKYNCKNLCLSGGVAQNSLANGKIINKTKFKNIYVPSAPHDSGLALGSALYHYNSNLNYTRIKFIKSAFYGGSYNEEDICSYLDSKKINYKIYSDKHLFSYVAKSIENGNVVGWFQDRSEFGPRALGNRSILMDPRRNDAKDILNNKIKKRESFRPFAPSILKEFGEEYFENYHDSYFMQSVFLIKKEKRDLIPAVTHIDGTGRLQSVDKEISPKFYKLIYQFYKNTNVPVLLNTSFNENEPIVESYEDAINCYLRTNMDMLVLNNVVLVRKN